MAGSKCVSGFVSVAISVKRMVGTCGPAQVPVPHGVATKGHLVTTWCCAFVVEVVVGTATVSTLRDLVAGHAHIGRVAELKAGLAH